MNATKRNELLDFFAPILLRGENVAKIAQRLELSEDETRRELRERRVVLRRLDYRVYLQTAHWQAMRADALERAEGRCQVCNTSDRLEVHHRSYRTLGLEDPADLTVLCAQCHGLFHGKD